MKQKKIKFLLVFVLTSQLLLAQKLKFGVYVDENNPDHYFEIKNGKEPLFYLMNYRIVYYGKYIIKNDTLILEHQYSYQEIFIIKNDYLIGDDGRWFLWKGGKTNYDYAKSKKLPLPIAPGQSVQSLTRFLDGEVFFNDKKIGMLSPDSECSTLILYFYLPLENLAICQLIIDCDKVESYILDMKDKNVLGKFCYNQYHTWIEFSPDKKYATFIEGHYREELGDDYLYVINLTKKVPICHKISLKLSKEGEIQDIQSIKWINPKMFQVRVNIVCDFWYYSNLDKGCDQDEVIRAYDVQVDASTLSFSYKRIK